MLKWIRKAAALCAVMVMMVPLACAQEDALHVLLIGVDAAKDGQRGRSDSMMLARIDAGAEQVQLVSFLRDLYVPIPGHGRSRLNAAYQYGGEELLKETLRQNFGVRIDRTVTVDFDVLRELVDELGGVEIEVTEAERKHLNKLLLEAGKKEQQLAADGIQHLNGDQALMYARIRKIDSDFQRTSRQQTLIAAMMQEMAQMGRWELFKLAVRHLGQIETDLSIGDLTRLAPLFSTLGDMAIRTAHVPFEGTYGDATANGMMVLKADREKNRKALERFWAEQ